MSGEWEKVFEDSFKSSAREMYTIKPVGPNGALKVIEVVEFVDTVTTKNMLVMLKAMMEQGVSP
jgi:hypothetical protein